MLSIDAQRIFLYEGSTDVSAEILGMNKIVSHDSVQRGLDKIDETKASEWLNNAYLTMYEPLLTEPYILDLDPTVKMVCGRLTEVG